MPLLPANPQAPRVALDCIRRITGRKPQELPPAPSIAGATITANHVYLTDTRTMMDLGFSAIATIGTNAVFQTWVQDFSLTKTVAVAGDGPLLEVVFGIGYRVCYSAVGWTADVGAGFSALAAKAHAESKNLHLRVELIGISPTEVDFPYMDIADTDFSLATYGKLAQFGRAVSDSIKRKSSVELVPVAFSYSTTDLLVPENIDRVTRSTLYALWSLRLGRPLVAALEKIGQQSDPIDAGAVRSVYAHMLRNPALLGPGSSDGVPVPSQIQTEASKLLVQYNQ